MLVVKIALGLIGLGIVVFIHELGHFLAARLMKIDVEAFSIGWGNPILKKKIGTVEYRLGMFPIGGYCKMRDDGDYKEAWENREKGIMPEKGTYLAASPQARILDCFAGPFFNFLFAVILLSFLWGIGFEINTFGSRIILASEISGETSVADAAGFMTGDRIIEINGRAVNYFHEVQENIALNPERALNVLVDRNGEIVHLNVTPALDRTSGAGRIGVFFWNDPVIGAVTEGSPAAHAGLLPGDIITSANGTPVRNSLDFMQIMEQRPESLTLGYERNGRIGQAQFSGEIDLTAGNVGISWALISYRTPNLSVPAAIAKGVKEGFRTLAISVKSLRLLFMGIDLTQAVSGPARITYMMGDAATQSFEQGIGRGLRSMMEFISLISIALCIMNLLPLPIIDGGMILLFSVELIRGKPAHPKAISVFQTCGMFIIFGLLLLAVFGDVLYFVGR
jgi:regulator of sigma E protease